MRKLSEASIMKIWVIVLPMREIVKFYNKNNVQFERVITEKAADVSSFNTFMKKSAHVCILPF